MPIVDIGVGIQRPLCTSGGQVDRAGNLVKKWAEPGQINQTHTEQLNKSSSGYVQIGVKNSHPGS